MADFNQPVLSSLYSDMLNILKERDEEALIWMEGSTNTNLPLNAKRWNSSNNYFEKFNGTTWTALTAKYNIDVEKLDGCTVNDLGTAVTDLWTASKIGSELSAKLNSSSYTAADILTKLKTVDGASSGLDADLLDGLHASSTNNVNSIVARDASGNFSAGTITAALTGNAATATKLQTARTIGGVSFDGTENINLPGVNTAGNQNTTGNATTATKLQTSRTINGVSFDGTADITIPSIPTGGIIMWSGSIVSIPAGWALCNGQNGTPNLQDRFVIGAGSAYGVGVTGGSKDAIVVSHTHTQAAHNHTATTDSAGAHTHTVTYGYQNNESGSGRGMQEVSTSFYGRNTATTSSSGAHTHSLTTNTVTPTINSTGSDGTNANLPPYYALAYIMKL